MPSPAAPPSQAPPMPTPPPGVNIIGLKPPKPPPPPRGEIKLGRDSGPPQSAPKPGSPRENLFRSLREKAGVVEEQPAPPPAQPEAPQQPQQSPGVEDVETPEQEAPAAETPAETQEQPETPEAPKTDKGKKVSPWKLVESYKAKISELEKKISDASSLPNSEKEKLSKQIDELAKRNAALEEEMRFVDYSRSDEFKQKYDEPYKAAWNRALSEFSELTIQDESGKERPVNDQDLLQLCNLSLKEARKWALDKFGDFADDAMSHRKEIKNLFSARAQALIEARKKGDERTQALTKEQSEMSDFIRQTWTKANEEVLAIPEVAKFFTPTEGDDSGNEQLQKGFALVDQGFNEFSKLGDKSIPREEKAKIIKRHVAIRNRAAAFGRLVTMLAKANQQNKALSDELKKFKSSQPPSSPSAPSSTDQPGPRNVKEEVFGALRKLAR